jgi:NAD(P)-dependent dehydrogenase (short-subunit alcohol dehydrogenase family)
LAHDRFERLNQRKINMDDVRDESPVPDYAGFAKFGARTAVVMGGGNGIGRQTCHALSQAGASVVCIDWDAGRAKAVAAEVGGIALTGDITQREEVQRLLDDAEQQSGPIRTLVDIVGMPLTGPLSSMTDERWAEQFNLVLTHAFLAAQIGAPKIAANGGGSMVFVSSLAGMVQIPGHIAYGIAKAGMIRLVAGLGQEYGPRRVRVNAIAPGFVRTPRVSALFSSELWKRIDDMTPLGIAGTPAEMASAIWFLASELASHITGQTLIVDGGLFGSMTL